MKLTHRLLSEPPAPAIDRKNDLNALYQKVVGDPKATLPEIFSPGLENPADRARQLVERAEIGASFLQLYGLLQLKDEALLDLGDARQVALMEEQLSAALRKAPILFDPRDMQVARQPELLVKALLGHLLLTNDLNGPRHALAVAEILFAPAARKHPRLPDIKSQSTRYCIMLSRALFKLQGKIYFSRKIQEAEASPDNQYARRFLEAWNNPQRRITPISQAYDYYLRRSPGRMHAVEAQKQLLRAWYAGKPKALAEMRKATNYMAYSRELAKIWLSGSTHIEAQDQFFAFFKLSPR